MTAAKRAAKRAAPGRSRRVSWVLGAVAAAAVLILALPSLALLALSAPSIVSRAWNCFGHGSFDARTWREPALAAGTDEVRSCMVDDLLEDGALVGRTRADVVALLGEPAPTSYHREWDLVYRVGMERGPFSIDSEWLVLRLGADGRVTEARLVTD